MFIVFFFTARANPEEELVLLQHDFFENCLSEWISGVMQARDSDMSCLCMEMILWDEKHCSGLLVSVLHQTKPESYSDISWTTL